MPAASQIDMLETLFSENDTSRKEKYAIIDGHPIPYSLLIKNISNPRLEFKLDRLSLTVRAGDNENVLINRHKKWVLGKYLEIRGILDNPGRYPLRTGLDRAGLLRESKRIVSIYEDELAVKAKGIKARKMTATWGSLSPRGIITISTLAGFLPDDLLRYILYHEVLHLKRANHGRIFRRYMTRKFPDMKILEKTLYAYWLIIRKTRP